MAPLLQWGMHWRENVCHGTHLGNEHVALNVFVVAMWGTFAKLFPTLQPQRHSLLPLLAKLRAMARILGSIALPIAAAIAFLGPLDGNGCRQLTAASPSGGPINCHVAAMLDALARQCVPWHAPWQRAYGT